MDLNKIELKPCPMCGGAASPPQHVDGEVWIIRCLYCELRIHRLLLDEVVEAWNTRIATEVSHLRAAVKEAINVWSASASAVLIGVKIDPPGQVQNEPEEDYERKNFNPW